MSYTLEFEAFWSDMLQRPGSCPKKLCNAYWMGLKPLVDGSRITPADWPEIHEGARIRRQLDDTDPEFRMNAGKWMYNGEWEGWLAQKAALEARQAELTEERKEQVRRAEFAREFKAWSDAQRRMPGEPKPTVEEFMAEREGNVVHAEYRFGTGD